MSIVKFIIVFYCIVLGRYLIRYRLASLLQYTIPISSNVCSYTQTNVQMEKRVAIVLSVVRFGLVVIL